MSNKKLSYERADDMSVLSDFYCGITDMDNFIHNTDTGLQKAIKRKDLETFIIKDDECIVAILSICDSSIKTKLKTGEQIEYNTKEIEYLAVLKDRRNNGIGRQIIQWVEENFCNDIKILSVSAYIDIDSKYTAEPFYEKCGFFRISKPHQLADHVKMAKFI